MSLLMLGLGAWFVLESTIMSWVVVLVFMISVMLYVAELSQHVRLKQQPVMSRVPIYSASIVSLFGILFDSHLVFGVGVSVWVYFLLRWLQHLEQRLIQLQHATPLEQTESVEPPYSVAPVAKSYSPAAPEANVLLSLEHWIKRGNPVLKAAVVTLVIGVILLLRFAVENWQLSLQIKLLGIASAAVACTALGCYLWRKNPSFAIALQGLGLVTLCFTLFFSYYTATISSFAWASVLFMLIMLATLYLSLRQKSIELALIALGSAYLAPFTLPIKHATATEFLAYYLVVSLVVLAISSRQAWKLLNQIAFVVTLILGTTYTLLHATDQQRDSIALLVFLHSGIFIWLAHRFGQLIAKDDIQSLNLKPLLDVALLFTAPLLSYVYLYLLYFDEISWQALWSAIYVVIYAVLYRVSAAQFRAYYLGLACVFLSFIPAIVLPEHWSIVGWASLAVMMLVYALQRQSAIGRYIAIGLLVAATLCGLYYFFDFSSQSEPAYWYLALCYVFMVCFANWQQRYREQLENIDVVVLGITWLLATLLLQFLMLEHLVGPSQAVISLVWLCCGYLIAHIVLLRRGATLTWLVPKWIGSVSILLLALGVVLTRIEQGVLLWNSLLEQVLFCIAMLSMTWVCLQPVRLIQQQKEWTTSFSLISLSLASTTLIPHMPYFSVVILPTLFLLWAARQDGFWQACVQARSSLVLLVIWMITSQCFAVHSFTAYLIPIFNPFDALSITMLGLFIWLLLQQRKLGLESGLFGVCSVLGILWLSSYILLRALHVYLGTPYNSPMLWENATVQLSLTVLWLSLALVSMLFATRKKIRLLWLLGSSILVLVSLKLVLLDLSHIGTLARVLSFLFAGAVMLIIAYIAPMPEQEN